MERRGSTSRPSGLRKPNAAISPGVMRRESMGSSLHSDTPPKSRSLEPLEPSEPGLGKDGDDNNTNNDTDNSWTARMGRLKTVVMSPLTEGDATWGWGHVRPTSSPVTDSSSPQRIRRTGMRRPVSDSSPSRRASTPPSEGRSSPDSQLPRRGKSGPGPSLRSPSPPDGGQHTRTPSGDWENGKAYFSSDSPPTVVGDEGSYTRIRPPSHIQFVDDECATHLRSADCVTVVVRCRPMNPRELKEGRRSVVEVFPEEQSVYLHRPVGFEPSPPKGFTFDVAFDERATQTSLYENMARPIVDGVLQGYNGTIFAYGQTGTGKTYTIEGFDSPSTARGLVHHAFNHVFDAISHGIGEKSFLVQAAYYEIYNEDIRDLLVDDAYHLELHEHPDAGVYVKDLTTYVVKDLQEIEQVFFMGRQRRTVGETLLNIESSRSHAIFTIIVESSELSHIRMGKLNLVDLAGSERVGRTGTRGYRFYEATRINLSLSALGNVISALVDKHASHIPYRDSKLTRLLQDSLGGNANTLMIATVGPADYAYEETLSTLRYANRAKNIQNRPRINEDPTNAMLREFQEEIRRLRQELEEKDEVLRSLDSGTSTAWAAKAMGYREQQMDMGHQERQELKRQLDVLQGQLLEEGRLHDMAAEQETELQSKKMELEEHKRSEEALIRRLKEQEEKRLMSEEKFESLSEEVDANTRKLKRMWTKYQAAREEAKDLEKEFQLEREDYLDTIRKLSREIELRNCFMDFFVSAVEWRRLEDGAKCEEGTWSLPPLYSIRLGGVNLARVEYPLILNLQPEDTDIVALTSLDGLQVVKRDALKELNLSHNRVTELRNLDMFENLERVNASSNRIMNAHIDVAKLQFLDLSDNALSAVPQLNTPNLAFLDLSHNQIMGCLDRLAGAPALVSLTLASNSIHFSSNDALQSATYFLTSLSRLKTLDVRENPFLQTATLWETILTATAPTLRSLSGTTITDAQRTSAQKILSREREAEKGRLVSMTPEMLGRHLGLSDPEELSTLDYPVAVDLNGERHQHQLVSLEGLDYLKDGALKSLLISKNNLTSVDRLSRFSRLMVLDASYNAIRDVPMVFLKLAQLDLSHNELTRFPNFNGMPDLRILDLSYNQISDSWSSIANCRKLVTCNLSNNKLDWEGNRLTEEISYIRDLKNLQSLGMANNPFLKQLDDWRAIALTNCLSLQEIDGVPVTQEELTRLGMGLLPDSMAMFNTVRVPLTSRKTSLINVFGFVKSDTQEDGGKRLSPDRVEGSQRKESSSVSLEAFLADQKWTFPLSLDLSTHEFHLDSLSCLETIDSTVMQCLNVSNNHLTALQHLKNFPLLEEVRASRNVLQVVNLALPKLKTLILSHNKLSALPFVADLPSLTHLDVSHNACAGSLGELRKNTALQTVNLSFNQFSWNVFDLHQEIGLLQALPLLDSLDLSHNPFQVNERYCRAMILAASPSIKIMNGSEVKPKERPPIPSTPSTARATSRVHTARPGFRAESSSQGEKGKVNATELLAAYRRQCGVDWTRLKTDSVQQYRTLSLPTGNAFKEGDDVLLPGGPGEEDKEIYAEIQQIIIHTGNDRKSNVWLKVREHHLVKEDVKVCKGCVAADAQGSSKDRTRFVLPPMVSRTAQRVHRCLLYGWEDSDSSQTCFFDGRRLLHSKKNTIVLLS